MPCSVKLNDCTRGQKTFLNITHFTFNGAPGKHSGRGGSFPRPWGSPD